MYLFFYLWTFLNYHLFPPSLITSSVYSKLWRNWRDPWWKTFVSSSFSLTSWPGNSRIYYSIWYNLVIYFVHFDLFLFIFYFYFIKLPCISSSQGLCCHCFLCQQSLWDGEEEAALSYIPGLCLLCRAAHQQLDCGSIGWVPALSDLQLCSAISPGSLWDPHYNLSSTNNYTIPAL